VKTKPVVTEARGRGENFWSDKGYCPLGSHIITMEFPRNTHPEVTFCTVNLAGQDKNLRGRGRRSPSSRSALVKYQVQDQHAVHSKILSPKSKKKKKKVQFMDDYSRTPSKLCSVLQ
jgi:hypothetical protein